MKIFYTDHFELPLPDGHRFPMAKYRLLRNRLVDDELHRSDIFLVPHAASDSELHLVHCADYVNRVRTGDLSAQEQRRIGFPWSEKMAERSRRSTGATLAAARMSLAEGISVNLAGGTHHAMRAVGEGFCVFNDAAVAIRCLQSENKIERAVIIDLDVHQGNGSAQIFADDPSVFTFSVQGERNFPLRQFASDLDIDLPDDTSDAGYLDAVSTGLDVLSKQPRFDLAIFLAGADPFEGDRLGRLAVTKEGLRQRDEMVFAWMAERRLPCAVAMAGGYANAISDIVDIHASTVGTASRYWKKMHQ